MNFIAKQGRLLLIFATLATPIFAQEIKELKDLGEKGGSVEVAIPSDQQFNKSDKICFQSEKKKKVGCGKIFKINVTSIFVRVTAATFAKLKSQHVAILEDADGKSPDAAPKLAATNNIRLTLSPVFVSPTAYHTVVYAAPSLADSTTANDTQYWLPDKSSAASLYSVMCEWVRFLGPKSGYSLGLRYRTNPETSILGDYVSGVSSSYISISHRFSGLAFLADYAFYKNEISSAFNLFFAAGLEFEHTTLDIVATKTDDTVGQTQTLATLSSKLIAASLRMRPGVDWNPSKWFGIHTGVTVMVPLLKLSASTKASVDDPHSLNKTTASEDLSKAAGHKLNRYGVGADLGLSFKF